MKVKLTDDAIQAARKLPSGPDLVAYFENGQPPGSFTQALLTNDLLRSAAHADSHNLPRLANYARWLYWHAPSGLYGNVEIIAKHLKECREEEKGPSTA